MAVFILRQLHWDKNREVEGSAEHLIESLKTLGLTHDEGPDMRKVMVPTSKVNDLIYIKWAEKLIASGRELC